MTYADYEWFLEHDFSRYAGKWVAIIEQKIVATGKEASHVLKEVEEKYPKKKPFLTKIRDHLTIL